MELVCPSCKTQHQVSVLRNTYKRLPCRKCGTEMPVDFPEGAVSEEPERPKSDEPKAEYKKESLVPFDYVTPPETATESGTTDQVSTVNMSVDEIEAMAPVETCTSCAARYDARLDTCPLCGHSERVSAGEGGVSEAEPKRRSRIGPVLVVVAVVLSLAAVILFLQWRGANP